MTTIPKAAIDAAAKAIWECADDEVGWEATLSLSATGDAYMVGQVKFVREQAEAAILAALPHLGEPVAWTTPGEIDRLRKGLTHKLLASTSVAWAKDGVPLYLAPVPAAPAIPVANCCICGRIIDTREMSAGGDGFGVELSDGQWTCSSGCWETATNTGPYQPVPVVPAVKSLEWTRLDICLHSGWYDIYDKGPNWANDRYSLERHSDVVGNYPAEDAAKDAAQADYDQIISSALNTSAEHVKETPELLHTPAEQTLDPLTDAHAEVICASAAGGLEINQNPTVDATEQPSDCHQSGLSAADCAQTVPDWVADFLNRRTRVEEVLRKAAKGGGLSADEAQRLSALLSVPSEYLKPAVTSDPATPALVEQMAEALRSAILYVEDAVIDDGGIETCEIQHRISLENCRAALAAYEKEAHHG